MHIAAKYERNLRYLAAFLAALPDDYDSFHMDYFCNYRPDDLPIGPVDTKTQIERCGTVACAVGHLPLLGYRTSRDEDHLSLSLRLTGLEYGEYDIDVWEWCFGGLWSSYDNTPHGAAKRIIFMLTADWNMVKEAVEFIEVHFKHMPEDAETTTEISNKAQGYYDYIEVPPLTSLDLTHLPKQASFFADNQRRGEPVLSFLANHA